MIQSITLIVKDSERPNEENTRPFADESSLESLQYDFQTIICSTGPDLNISGRCLAVRVLGSTEGSIEAKLIKGQLFGD